MTMIFTRPLYLMSALQKSEDSSVRETEQLRGVDISMSSKKVLTDFFQCTCNLLASRI